MVLAILQRQKCRLLLRILWCNHVHGQCLHRAQRSQCYRSPKLLHPLGHKDLFSRVQDRLEAGHHPFDADLVNLVNLADLKTVWVLKEGTETGGR